jgi:hypothetical protein
MAAEILFYQYRKVDADDRNHTIENLANNQFYFSDPTKFNDTFDCKVFLDRIGTEEQWIPFIVQHEGCNHTKAKEILYNNKAFKKEGDRFRLDPNEKIHREIGLNMHGELNKNALPRVCCFSETKTSIQMWGHYSDHQQGICLCFRPLIDPANLYHEDYFLYLDKTPLSALISSPFFKVNYIDEALNPVNMFDIDGNRKLTQFLYTKFSGWRDEKECRMLLNEDELEDGVIHYYKDDLEGVIFGCKMKQENAQLVYNTVKKNYLDEGVTVNFYEAKEAPRKYSVDIVPIDDVEKYIDSLRE